MLTLTTPQTGRYMTGISHPLRFTPARQLAPSCPPTNCAIERCLAAALASVGVREVGSENRGQMVELYLAEVGLPAGQPWCAAFVSHIGWWSQYDHTTKRSAWPLPRTGGCAHLGDVAAIHGLLRAEPARGAVFLLHSPTLNRFAHTGIVLSVDATVDAYVCTTVEGNTNDDGSREGRKSCLRSRTFPRGARHRFVHWWEGMGR